MVLCIRWHSQKSWRLFGWGDNSSGQLGFERMKQINKPKDIELKDLLIVKISWGAIHSLLLSKSGQIYVFDGNVLIVNEFKYLKLNHEKEFIDIASHWSQFDNVYYVWGRLKSEHILVSIEIEFKSLNEIFFSLLQSKYWNEWSAHWIQGLILFWWNLWKRLRSIESNQRRRLWISA